MKLVLVFISCIYVSYISHKNAIASYILDDIKSSVYVKSRTQYGEMILLNGINIRMCFLMYRFQNRHLLRHKKPHIEFGHFHNHSKPTSESMTRLPEAYVMPYCPLALFL